MEMTGAMERLHVRRKRSTLDFITVNSNKNPVIKGMDVNEYKDIFDLSDYYMI